ncbi:MAG TPA: PAS domain S-box protein [Bacteroidales bacterium]|nr:PAS domain S-box protein [Bacteroidales bacterium]
MNSIYVPDIRTIIISYSAVNLACIVVLSVLWLRNRKRYKGTGLWVIASLFQFIGITLIYLRDSVPSWLSYVLSNALLITAVLIGVVAIEKYAGKKRGHVHDFIIILIYIILQSWFTYHTPDLNARRLVIGTAMALISVQGVWVVFYRFGRRELSLTYGIGIIYLFYGLVSLFRIVKCLVCNDNESNFFSSTLIEAVILLSYQMVYFMQVLILVLMYNKRLLADITGEEEKFVSLFKSSPSAILITKLHGGEIIEMNRNFEQLSGYRAVELIGRPVGDFDFFENEIEKKDLLKRISDLGSIPGTDRRFRKKDGEMVPSIYSAELMTLNNEPLVISTILDKTEVVHAQIEVERSSGMYKSLFENMINGFAYCMMLYDPDGRPRDFIYKAVNKAFETQTGLKDVAGKKVSDVIPGILESDSELIARYGRVSKGGEPEWFETWVEALKMWFAISVYCPAEGYFVAVFDVITNRKAAEAERFRLLDIIDNSTNEIYVFRSNSLDLEFVSRGALKNTGYKKEEIEQMSMADLIPVLDRVKFRKLINPLLVRKKQTVVFETYFIRRNGSVYDAEVHIQLYRSDEDFLLAAIVTDISERKKSEQAIKKMNEELEERVRLRTFQLEESNRELESFSYSVSHDLRAPLRAIHSFTKILREDYGKKFDDEGLRICDVIETSAIGMGELIDGLLAFSRAGRTELKMSRTDMNHMVRSVVEDLLHGVDRDRIGISIGNLRSSYCDVSAIKHVWSNLISNAIKYSSKKEKAFIKISSERNGEFIWYEIEDNGTGFEMKYSDKLFKVFQRLHSSKEFEGNGVGLAIVHRIVTRHGGKVRAESENGKGARFYFSLPRKRLELAYN